MADAIDQHIDHLLEDALSGALNEHEGFKGYDRDDFTGLSSWLEDGTRHTVVHSAAAMILFSGESFAGSADYDAVALARRDRSVFKVPETPTALLSGML